jgi:hypothetical protein
MIASIAGTFASVAKAAFSPSTPVKESKFSGGVFPTSVRYLYLRSKKNQNIVTTIGYFYEAKDIIRYQIARCHNESHKRKSRARIYSWDKPKKAVPLFAINDTFRKEVGRQIVEGRLREYEPLYLNVTDKEDMYNKFIMIYHPDKDARRKASQALVLEVFSNQSEE